MSYTNLVVGTRRYKIAEGLELEISVRENKFNIPLEALIEMAARRNKKRGFLFVSKVIGKHIPINPLIIKVGGSLMARIFMEEVEKKIFPGTQLIAQAMGDYSKLSEAVSLIDSTRLEPEEPTLFMGFAETATGLGHAMYSAFSGNIGFIHTTRDVIKGLESVFTFEEEHCHAPSHLCYSTERDFFDNFSRIVLVDDEITTGNTCRNLIRALNKRFPCKKYAVASILDWRSEEDVQKFEALSSELNTVIDTVSIIKGSIECLGSSIDEIEGGVPEAVHSSIEVETIEIPAEDRLVLKLVETSGKEKEALYTRMTGRFGIRADENYKIESFISRAGQKLREIRTKRRCLCLGYGEFIYLPAMIASKMGEDIFFHSTTRSPVHPVNKEGYAIRSAICFENLYDTQIPYFVYNIYPGQFEEVFLFLERDIEKDKKDMLAGKFAECGVQFLRFVVFS